MPEPQVKQLATAGAAIKAAYEGQPNTNAFTTWHKDKLEALSDESSAGVTAVNGRAGDVVLTQSDVGLDNVDNTSDVNKPISAAAAAALASKATPSDISTAINALLGGSGPALDTLNELAAALGNDPAFSTTVMALIATKAKHSLSINTQADNYVLTLADSKDTYVRMNKETAQTLTVPPHADVPIPVGSQIPVRQSGAGGLTIVAGAGVTINTPETLKLRKQGSAAVLIQVALNVWDLTGDLEKLP